MNNEWKEVVLGDVVKLIGGGTPKRSNPEFWGGDIPWLSVKDFNDGLRFVRSSNETITELGLQKSSTKILSNGQIIISARGTIGALAQVNEPMAFNQSCYGVDGKEGELENNFLYYLLKYSIGKLKRISHGAVFDTITKETFQHIIVNLPPLPEQKAIAHILGTLDDKIELNRKMNETLEAMAQAMFKSWFVDFDPVIDNALAQGNEIPEALKAKAARRKAVLASGQYKALPAAIQALFPASFVYNEELGKWIPEEWEVSKLESLVEVKYGKDHKKLKEGVYPCYGSGGVMRYVEQALCEIESVLIPRKGSLNNMMYVRQPFWSVDTMFFTLFKKQNMVKFLFYYLKKFNFAEMNVGSAVPSMTTKVLNNIDLITPSEIILEKFEKQIELIATRKESNTKQNESLVRTRDLLLSQLISGKTRLPESFIQQFESQTEPVS